MRLERRPRRGQTTMSAPPQPRRRRSLGIGIGLRGLVVARRGGPPPAGWVGPSQGPAGSSYSTEPDGAAAYAELLGRAGHQVQRLRDPLDPASLDGGQTPR